MKILANNDMERTFDGVKVPLGINTFEDEVFEAALTNSQRLAGMITRGRIVEADSYAELEDRLESEELIELLDQSLPSSFKPKWRKRKLEEFKEKFSDETVLDWLDERIDNVEVA